MKMFQQFCKFLDKFLLLNKKGEGNGKYVFSIQSSER